MKIEFLLLFVGISEVLQNISAVAFRSLVFPIMLPLVQCMSLTLMRKLWRRKGLSYSDILIDPSICEMNHLAVGKYQEFASLSCSNFKRFMLKSPVNIIFRWSTHPSMSSIRPATHCAPYLRNNAWCHHNFWYKSVKWWYL